MHPVVQQLVDEITRGGSPAIRELLNADGDALIQDVLSTMNRYPSAPAGVALGVMVGVYLSSYDGKISEAEIESGIPITVEDRLHLVQVVARIVAEDAATAAAEARMES